jgi:hypothetical protein
MFFHIFCGEKISIWETMETDGNCLIIFKENRFYLCKMDLTGREWKYGNDLWISDDETSAFSYQSDFPVVIISPSCTHVWDTMEGQLGGRVVHPSPPPKQQSRRGSKLDGKINISDGKFYFLRSKKFQLLSRIYVNPVETFGSQEVRVYRFMKCL